MPKHKSTPLITQAAQAQTGHHLKNLLLIYIADYCCDGLNPSQTEIANRCVASRSHVNRMLSELVSDGWIFQEPVSGENDGRRVKYHLNTERLS